MYELKTKLSDKNVLDFVMSIENEKRREDALKLLDIFHEVTEEEPRMWGDSIIGYGTYHYKYATGHEGDWMRTAFSPRKQNLTIYMMYGAEAHSELLADLGKYKLGKACLYMNKLEDVNIEVLKKLISESYHMEEE